MGFNANRRFNTKGVCTYLDKNIQRAAKGLKINGFNLEEFDTFLEGMEQSVRLELLIEWRANAIHALEIDNMFACLGWCCALHLARYEHKHTAFLMPLALKGNKQKINAKQNANVRAKKYKSKEEELRELWNTGKYKTKALCAEQECAALGVSYDTARKYLRDPRTNKE